MKKILPFILSIFILSCDTDQNSEISNKYLILKSKFDNYGYTTEIDTLQNISKTKSGISKAVSEDKNFNNSKTEFDYYYKIQKQIGQVDDSLTRQTNKIASLDFTISQIDSLITSTESQVLKTGKENDEGITILKNFKNQVIAKRKPIAELQLKLLKELTSIHENAEKDKKYKELKAKFLNGIGKETRPIGPNEGAQ